LGSEGGQIAPTAPKVSASDATGPKLFAIAETAYNDT